MLLDKICKNKLLKDDSKLALYNVVMLGICFVFIQTSMVTLLNAQAYFMGEINKDVPEFTVKPYVASGLYLSMFAITNWVAPSIAIPIGPRAALAFGAIVHAIFYIQFVRPTNWVTYLSVVILGFGAAVMWAGQAFYLSLNSYEDTISRNVAIFWGIFPICMLVGNVYFMVSNDVDYSQSSVRLKFLIVLTAIGTCGIITVFLATKAIRKMEEHHSPFQILKDALKLSIRRDMLLMAFTAAHTGITFAIGVGVYSNMLSFNENFYPILKQSTILGISGIFISGSFIITAGSLAVLGTRIEKWGRYKVTIIGFSAHVTVAVLTMLNIPDGAADHHVKEDTTLNNNIYVAFMCSALLGVGDACFNTQLYSQLWTSFPDESPEAYSLARFIHSVGGAIIYIVTDRCGIYVVMSVFMSSAILGLSGFTLVSQLPHHLPRSRCRRHHKSQEEEDVDQKITN